jgi:hypothetical protein
LRIDKLYYTKVINRIISLFLWDTIEKEEIYEILDHNKYHIWHMTNETLSYELDDDNMIIIIRREIIIIFKQLLFR